MSMKFRRQPSVGTSSLRLQRSAPLAACLATALGLGSVSTPLLAATTWDVMNCNDSGPGSLRDTITNFAQSGDTVDLGGGCGGASGTITLTTGEIVVTQKDLKLQGPVGNGRTVAISGNHASRVIEHKPIGNGGTLAIDSLKIENGTDANEIISGGGCIRTGLNLNITRSSVTGCIASKDASDKGGGIFVVGKLILVSSTVSGNEAQGIAALGGGAYATNGTVAKYSTIDHNSAGRYGGGLHTGNLGSTSIVRSTITANSAGYFGGGIFFRNVNGGSAPFIDDSTISENTAEMGGGVAVAEQAISIRNSTVAFNHSNSAGGGLWQCCSAYAVTLQSSIVANNTTGAFNSPGDIELSSGSTIVGASNLVVSSNVALPGGTLASDPNLGPLQFNGGATQTHALLLGSPAIGRGNNSAGQNFDQRGHGYPRTSGSNASVDIGAYQFDSIFAADFE